MIPTRKAVRISAERTSAAHNLCARLCSGPSMAAPWGQRPDAVPHVPLRLRGDEKPADLSTDKTKIFQGLSFAGIPPFGGSLNPFQLNN